MDFEKSIRARRIEQANQIAKSMQPDYLIKGGKVGQEGEIREYANGKKYKKTGDKWIEVTGDKKGKEKEKESTSKTQGSSESSVGKHDIAQLTALKNSWKSDPDKAYEIFQSLPPDVQESVPQEVINSMVKNSHAGKKDDAAAIFDDKKEDKKEVGERGQAKEERDIEQQDAELTKLVSDFEKQFGALTKEGRDDLTDAIVDDYTDGDWNDATMQDIVEIADASNIASINASKGAEQIAELFDGYEGNPPEKDVKELISLMADGQVEQKELKSELKEYDWQGTEAKDIDSMINAAYGNGKKDLPIGSKGPAQKPENKGKKQIPAEPKKSATQHADDIIDNAEARSPEVDSAIRTVKNRIKAIDKLAGYRKITDEKDILTGKLKELEQIAVTSVSDRVAAATDKAKGDYLKSMQTAQKKLEKKVDKLSGGVASTSANREKLKQAGKELGDLKKQIKLEQKRQNIKKAWATLGHQSKQDRIDEQYAILGL